MVSPSPDRRLTTTRAFTLLELILAISVAMLVIGIGVLTIGSIGRERELRAHAGVLEATARGALQEAVKSGRTVSLQLSKSAFSLGDRTHPLGASNLKLRRAGESRWRPPSDGETWTFHPSGLCEPLAIRIAGNAGVIELQFDPLTAAAESTAVEIFAK